MPTATEEITPILPRHGVILLDDGVLKIRVRHGHLEIETYGFGEHHMARLARVGHNLERLVATSWDGFISLDALRWLAVQKIPLTIIQGSDILLSNPMRPADARMRRAQLAAEESGIAVLISRALISRKIQGQERVAREKLKDPRTAAAIADVGKSLAGTKTLEEIRILEARAASAFWTAWKGIEVTFPRKGKREVPEHWRRFSGRASLLTGTPKSATNPINCALNFLYAILLSESTIALMSMGLDPSLGYLHADIPNRDSLACDLIEGARWAVDSYVLDLISRPLDRNWFYEKSDGEVCLMPEGRKALSQTWRLWRSAVSPLAEMVADMLIPGAPTPLTARRNREAKAGQGLLHCRPCQPFRGSAASAGRRSPAIVSTARCALRYSNASRL
jgi:CRISPR-associated protein Cas1